MEPITELNNYILLNINATVYFNDDVDNNDNDDQPLWSIFLDRSQLVMVIIGVIANCGTSITLTKNGQVSIIFIYIIFKYFLMFLCFSLLFRLPRVCK